MLVSGGTQGMGGAVARAAVDEGATVAVSGRREDVGRAFAAELTERGGREALFVPADVADVAQAQGSVEEVVRRFGRIDCLVNAAGLTTPGLAGRHHAGALRRPRRGEPARAVLPHAGGRARHARARRAGHDRQRHHDVVARRAAVPRAVRRHQGGSRGPDPQRGPRPPLGPDPHERGQHRLDRDRGRGRDPARVPRRRRRLARAGGRRAADGPPRPAGGRRRPDRAAALRPQRRGHRSVIDWDQQVPGGSD